MGSQRFCLRWNNHQSNLLSVFDQLLHDESFVDVTLAVEGQFLRAHKMVLSACSPYFQALFVGHPDKHPIVILKDVPYSDMRSLLDFMYRGEVSVDQDRLTAFLKVAESLRIKGLTEVNEERCDLPSIANSLLSQTPPPAPQPPSQTTPQPQPPNLHRIQIPQVKRHLPNPMLNSALTAPPKRKRGRPRKLSGSSPGTPNPSNNENELEEIKQNNIEPLGASTPNSLPPSVGMESTLNNNESESQEGIKKEDGEEVMEVTPPPSTTPVPISTQTDPADPKLEPTPGTSTQDSIHSFQSNTTDGERFSTSGKTEERGGAYDSDDGSQHSDLIDECYEDMIACSPGSSENEEHLENPSGRQVSLNTSVTIEPEFADDDITQYEMDSFQTLMNQQVAGGYNLGEFSNLAVEGRRRIDKMSIRKYCTREGNHMYRCSVCSKTYTHISNFCRHFLSAHCGVKQDVQCPVCYKPFTRKDNMMTHAKQVHGVTIMKNLPATHDLPSPEHQDYNTS